MAAYLPPMKKTQDPYINIEKAKKNWKAKHEELIRTVKAARGEKVDIARIPSKPVDTKKCPHCARNFGPKAYDRHVEFCREKAQRISTAPVISQLAKERLEARIKVNKINILLAFSNLPNITIFIINSGLGFPIL